MLSLPNFAQRSKSCNHQHNCSHLKEGRSSAPSQLSNDPNIDVKYYHIDIEVSIDMEFIFSEVTCLMEITADNVNSVKLDLDSAMNIFDISAPAQDYTFTESVLNIQLSSSYNTGDTLSLEIIYFGFPTLAGGYKGLRYETHDGDEPIIATLSTPYLAHYWYPCKDGPYDKADSVEVDITIPDTTISNIPLIGVSNGLLESVEDLGNSRKFHWKHRYPIVPYYVMLAISNYEHFSQDYEGANGDDFPIDYYVFESHLTQAQAGVEQIPEVMDFFSEIFGPYPFAEEKYGMTQLGYYGGIENQTNSIINNMGLGWFNTSVHELAHMWYADMITCQEWNHGWLNEGFATYSEALWEEHAYGNSAYQSEMAGNEYYDGGSIYMSDVSNPYTVFQGIIYSKGAYALHMLRGILGDEAFFEAVYEYSINDEWMYGNAVTEDLQNIFEEVSDLDLDYFFDQWIYDERYPDYHFNYEQDDVTGATALSIVQVQGPDNGWRDVFKMPMDVMFSFENGTDSTLRIMNQQQVQSYFYDFEETVNNVQLDPEKWVLKNASFDASINVGLDELDASQEQSTLIIYPNPSSGKVFIGYEGMDILETEKVSVYTMDGRLAATFTMNHDHTNKTLSLDLGGLDKGAYLIKIAMNEGSRTEVLMIE